MKKLSAILFAGLFLTAKSLYSQTTTPKERNCLNSLTEHQLYWINYTIVHPVNDYTQAFITRALKDEYPNASLLDVQRMQEEGLGENAEFFNVYMKKLTNSFEGDLLVMNTAKLFDTKLVVAEDLLTCYNEDIPKQTNSLPQVDTQEAIREIDRKAREAEKLKEQTEIQSKIYNLKEDSIKYQEFVHQCKKYLLEQLKTSNSFPAYSTIENGKYFGFRNIYKADYRINYQNFYEKKDLILSSKQGDETTFLESVILPLGPLRVKNYTVTTQANIENIEINYAKGTTKVKVKNGIIEFKNNFPPVEMQHLISKKIEALPNGLYQINYEAGQVMDESFVVIKPTKIKSPTGKILGGILLVAVVLFVL